MKMDVGTLEQTLGLLGSEVVNIIDRLVPVGQEVTGNAVLLLAFMTAASIMSGSHFLPQIIRMCAIASGTYWVLDFWPDILIGMRDASRAAVRLMIPGYGGPTALFSLAVDVFGRLQHETMAFSWAAPIQSAITIAIGAIAPILVLLGLSFIGILAFLAEITLLLGGALAPLVLPFLALPITTPLGWGAIQFLLTASVRVVACGAMSHLFAHTITASLSLQGSEDQLQNGEVAVLILLAMLSVMVGLSLNTIAGMLVGNGLGALGIGSVMRAGGAISAVAANGVRTGSIAGSAVSAVGRAGSAAATRASAGAVAKIGQSSGTGSAFA